MTVLEMKKEERLAVTIENEGEKIFGILHLPNNATIASLSVVIILHGYASSKIGGHRCYIQLAEALTSRGIACFRFDFRGSGDSEGDLSSMLIEHFLSDTVAVASYLEKQGFNKLALFGSSFGGSIALLASGLIHIQALALWAPVASGALWYKEWMEKNREAHFSSYQGVKMSEAFKLQFFNMRADKALGELKDIPILHMQNRGDGVVTISHKLAFEKYREGAQEGDGAPTLFKVYPDSEHQIGKSSSFPLALKETVEWFSKYL